MSFNYGIRSRHRASGRHFKLFSDELPRIEFDRASMEEYNTALNERHGSKGRRNTFRDANHDIFSLPSLETPEWEGLSDTENARPQSYSPFNPLNPNFARIHQNIQRRHTVKETHGPGEKNRIYPNSKFDRQQFTNAWHVNIRKSKHEKDYDEVHENGNVDGTNTSTESCNKVVGHKPPVPKKRSLFRELLDASAKENARMNRIKEGLKFKERNTHGHSSLQTCELNSNYHEKTDNVNQAKINAFKEQNSVPEVVSESDKVTKPGILKHGVRIREINTLKASTKKKFPVKPRLIHQEDLPLFGQDDSNNKTVSSNDEIKVSVYAEAPLNRKNDMMFVPLPSTKHADKQKRVNFHEHVDIKERTDLSELAEVDKERCLDVEVEEACKIYDSEKEIVHSENMRTSVQLHRRANVRHSNTSKSLQNHTVTIKHRHVPGDIQTYFNNSFVNSNKRTEHDNDKQDYIDSILLSSTATSHKAKGLQSKSVWKEARPARSEVLIHEKDPFDTVTISNSPVELTHLVTEQVTRYEGINEKRDHVHQSTLNIQDCKIPLRSPPKSPTTSPPKSPDVETVSDFTTFIDDELNFDNLPEEIDRSMLGEDLIKAYRFWDRKRKAFPNGLRKIVAPADRKGPVYQKQYGSVKTYRITNTGPDKQPIVHAPKNSKPSHSSDLVDWV